MNKLAISILSFMVIFLIMVSCNAELYTQPPKTLNEPQEYVGSQHIPGIVTNVQDKNSMYVDFGASASPEFQGNLLILLPRPLIFTDPHSLQGDNLTFKPIGHDYLGRPIMDAYYNGYLIDDLNAIQAYLKMDWNGP